MKKNWRKIFSVMLALIMVVTLIPFVGMVKPVDVKAEGVHTVDFSHGPWVFGDVTVSANYTAASVDLAENAVITLTNYDDSTMEVWVRGNNEQVRLGVQGNQTSLSQNGGLDLPDGVLIFDIVPAANSGGGDPEQGDGGQTFTVDFGATGSWTVNNVNVTASMGGQAVSGVKSNLTDTDEITLTGFDPDTMEVRVTEFGENVGDNPFWTKLTVNNGVTKIANRQNGNGGIPNNLIFTVNEKSSDNPGGGEGGQPGGGGNRIKPKISIYGIAPSGEAAGDAKWTGSPIVRDMGPDGMGAPDILDSYYSKRCAVVGAFVCEANDDGYSAEAERLVNGGYSGSSISGELRNQLGDYSYFTADNYPSPTPAAPYELRVDGYDSNGGNKVLVVLATNWGEKIERVTINNRDYTDRLMDYSSDESVFEHFKGQNVYNYILLDKDEADSYSIGVAVRPITEEECLVGNFLWSNDDSMRNSDAYIPNAEMTLISMKYKGEEFTEEQIASGRVKWIGSYTSMGARGEDGRMFGEMFVPAGAEVTMKIVPEHGYQVKSFNLSGSDFNFNPEECGIVTFIVGKGNFHIGGDTIPVNDKVSATATSVSDVKATITAGGDYAAGCANLSISNASPSDDKKSEFATAAGKEDVDLIGGENAYLAIDLQQVIYKANSQENADKENETWTQEIHDLGNGYSDVTMKFGNDVDVSTVVLLHNIGDGEDFETIRPISYDTTNHTATFRIKSFSTFAIAKAHTKTTPVTPSDTNTNTNTNTNSGSSSAPAAAAVDTVPKTAETFPMALLIILSIVSLGTMTTVVIKRRRM